MTAARRQHACDLAADQLSLADMHEALGRFVAGGTGRIDIPHGKSWDANAPSTLRDLVIYTPVTRGQPMLVDTGDLRSIQADFDETGRLMDEARARFWDHRCVARYRAECKVIVARENTPPALDAELQRRADAGWREL